MYSESQDPNVSRPFRVCEHCGQPTPSHEPQCVNCQAVSLQAVVAEQEAKAERRFLRALFARATPVTYAILVVNLALYLLMSVVAGGNILTNIIKGSDSLTLVAFGAKINELVLAGEWFRLVTPIFIHIGLLHIASNSYALWIIGPLIERLYGSARYLLLYLLAGIGGGILSLIWQVAADKPSGPSAGASGAIFGLFGVIMVFSYKYRKELPPNFRSAIKSSFLPVIVINLFIGTTIPFIDNAAHVGGLISGALLTLLIPYLAPDSKRVSKLGLITIAMCALVIIYSFARAYLVSEPYLEEHKRRAGRVENISN